MPQAIPAIILILGKIASGYAAWAGYAAYVLAAAAAYVLSGARDDTGNASADLTRSGNKVNTRATQEPIRIVYGQTRVGGNDIYIGVAGSSNDDLWMVQTLGEGECEGIYNDSDTGIDQVFLNNELYNTYGGNVTYYFHSGTSTQSYDTNLNAVFSDWTDCLKNVCYIVWKLTYDDNYFQGVPNRQVVLQGLKLYDFRDSTTAYSNNPVLCLYDYMTNDRYGMGIDSSKIDTTSWTSAANYCETKSWTFNAAITKNDSAQNILDMILAHFRGHIVWHDGTFYLRYSDTNYESTAMTIGDSQILQDESGKAQLQISQPSRFDKPDGIRIKWVDPDRNYVVDDIVIGDSAGVVKDVQLMGCTNRTQASRLGYYYLEREKLDKVVGGTFRDDALQLEPHDLVELTSTALGLSSQKLRVVTDNIQQNGLIGLSLAYESDDLYDDDYDLDIEDIYECTLPNVNSEPPSIRSGSVTEETYNYRLRTFTRLKVSFTAPSNYPWVRHYEVHVSFDNSTWNHWFNVAKESTDFVIDPVEESDTYYIRVKTVSIWGTKQTDANDYRLSKTVTGYSDPPSSLASLNAIVAENAINLYAAKLSDPDIELYEFRLGASWSGAVLLAALRSPNLSLKGVKPGSHTFYANTLGNNGQYGSTPRSASVSIKDPPYGWTVDTTETDDYL